MVQVPGTGYRIPGLGLQETRSRVVRSLEIPGREPETGNGQLPLPGL